MNAKECLEGFPEQVQEAYELGKGIFFTGIKKVLICGMGGSAIAGEILSNNVNIPVVVNRDYEAPEIDENTLVIVSSYSGNTEETLSAYEKLKGKTEKIMIITSGGKLAEEEHKILVPAGFQPRFALAYLFFPVLRILVNSGIDPGFEMRELVSNLKSIDKNRAESYANKMKNKIPLVYTTPRLKSVLLRWQAQINENANSFCHTNVFTELNHNEIQVFKDNDDFFAIIIRDKAEDERVRKQIEAAKQVIKNHDEIWVKGNSHLSKLFYAIYFGDYISYYLAEMLGEDPDIVKNIDFIKKNIR